MLDPANPLAVALHNGRNQEKPKHTRRTVIINKLTIIVRHVQINSPPGGGALRRPLAAEENRGKRLGDEGIGAEMQIAHHPGHRHGGKPHQHRRDVPETPLLPHRILVDDEGEEEDQENVGGQITGAQDRPHDERVEERLVAVHGDHEHEKGDHRRRQGLAGAGHRTVQHRDAEEVDQRGDGEGLAARQPALEQEQEQRREQVEK